MPVHQLLDVARGRFKPAGVKGKVVVVGATAERRCKTFDHVDDRPAPMPGPRYHANAMLTALDGFPLDDGRLNVLLLVLIGFCGTAVRRSALRMAFVLPVGGRRARRPLSSARRSPSRTT